MKVDHKQRKHYSLAQTNGWDSNMMWVQVYNYSLWDSPRGCVVVTDV